MYGGGAPGGRPPAPIPGGAPQAAPRSKPAAPRPSPGGGAARPAPGPRPSAGGSGRQPPPRANKRPTSIIARTAAPRPAQDAVPPPVPSAGGRPQHRPMKAVPGPPASVPKREPARGVQRQTQVPQPAVPTNVTSAGRIATKKPDNQRYAAQSRDKEELDTTFRTNVVKGAVEDLTLLTEVSNDAIVKNLYDRYMMDKIYTYIGPVLISVNPFKRMADVGIETIKKYQGTSPHDVPPHIYAVADQMYRHMTDDDENQCVIISGESGAGKTEASKLIMNHLAAVSGSSVGVDKVKEIILESNPLLEAFGNAKTLRNNNSSRFGKYFEILFDRAGNPNGGIITNFLLEKSRVAGQIRGERSFHIFYQLCSGATREERDAYRIESAQFYHDYLALSECFTVSGIDDVQEWADSVNAMNVVEIPWEDQQYLIRLLAAILYLGNVQFTTKDNDNAVIKDQTALEMAAYLLGVDRIQLGLKLTSRLIQTGGGRGRGSLYDVPLTVAQARAARDSLSKTLYSRLFDFIVESINGALSKHSGKASLSISVLDIYGFEIFENNGFEQFCINYVNEKLQQIFIELTLQREQEEYVSEGIKWTPIKFFNNKIVCEMIDGKRPPGVLCILNDVCKTMHGEVEGVDAKFIGKAQGGIDNPHFIARGANFTVKHYAGDVNYMSLGFVEKNKDILFKDIVIVLKTTDCPLLLRLFPEEVDMNDKKSPTTAGSKIMEQAAKLVQKLKLCTPSYVRCIKPNENKAPRDYDTARVSHQSKYLGLLENVRVRRAGFAYRGEFKRFIKRYHVCHPSVTHWRGDARSGCEAVMRALRVDNNEWTLGKTKMFIKSPETLFGMEDMRDRAYNHYAGRIQRAYRRLGGEGLRVFQETCYFWDMMVYNFHGVRGDPHFGQYVEWPEYQDHLTNAVEYGYKIWKNWWAIQKVMSLSPDQQEAMRQKIVSYDIFHDQKPWAFSRFYEGNYLSHSKNNPNFELYNEQERNMMATTGDSCIIFSEEIMKLNPSLKNQPRVIAVTNRSIFKWDIKNYKLKKQRIPLSNVSAISMSHQRDTYVCIHLKAPDRDLVIDLAFFNDEDKVSEFVTLLYQACWTVNGTPPEIEFKDTLRFNNNRTAKKVGHTYTMTFERSTDPNQKTRCAFRKGKGDTCVVAYKS